MQQTEDLQFEMADHKRFLALELEKRQARNPRFSLRSFARLLGISPGHLSHLISGRRSLTKKQALKISEKLELAPAQQRALFESLGYLGPAPTEVSLRQLAEEEFNLISDWHHYAILSLGDIQNNRADAAWIAKRLGISQREAADAFQRLQKMGFIEIKSGSFVQTGKRVSFASPTPSIAIRKYHRQNLELAKEKMDSVNIEKRQFSSITMSANPRQLIKIKNLIEQFEDEVCEQFEQGPQTEIYTMAIQLFPLTQEQA